MKLKKPPMSGAWYKWEEEYRRTKKSRAMCYKIMMRWQNRVLSSAWLTWEDDHRIQKEHRAIIKKILMRMLKGALSGAWKKWEEEYRTAQRQALLVITTSLVMSYDTQRYLKTFFIFVSGGFRFHAHSSLQLYLYSKKPFLHAALRPQKIQSCLFRL